MSLIFIHLSDIHFGQEKGGDLYIHDDVKEQILSDARDYVMGLDNSKADGVIISGDIAYAGKPKEYEAAGKWLDRLTAAVGCEVTAVQVVPGNHDVDRGKITAITQTTIDDIIKNGDDALDKYMQSDDDREFLYKQFEGYRAFAEGYDCPLDNDGRIKKHREVEIAPGRRIKFLGVNTALICSKSEAEEGGLILGKRQRVIAIEPGLETVVIAHHPLHWLQDSEDAKRYIKSRARVFISGHEHTPSHKCEKVNNEADLLMLASGAAVPPGSTPGYTYCYNVLEFSWQEHNDSLVLKIHGRIWDDENKIFTADNIHFNNGSETYVLNCPNFKKLPVKITDKASEPDTIEENKVFETSTMEFSMVDKEGGVLEEKEYQLVLLKYFRDLSRAQRLSVLIDFGAIPQNWTDRLTHSVERTVFDKLVQDGKLQQIHEKINQILQQQ
ncbi:3',5'-cyclic AMP phosphodiesterase CpdA [Mucilaginibacter gracilis]|uniref:3',5'-cyclic AMP phosphodiesterase CpdA n=1 Tax=Mucilaginibacter gracilis TaxID=423350 RepID=A0A495J0B9_9SPHI|nr:metallophosphoesterase [Mucilaginibacter gracilis]RKR82162.1 3',5'-cyclic AMP phosphodiesterase CpdA [Mucilaginibacter gracilis]